MTKRRKKTFETVPAGTIVRYTFDEEGVPLTKTVTMFDGHWVSTALLQPISIEAFERNLYEGIR